MPYSSKGKAANRKKIGINEDQQSVRQFFYNDFVTRVLLGHEAYLNPEHQCRERLKRVAIIHVEMTRADAILLRKTVRGSISAFTMTGGLLSLYAGFSFLSLSEVIFWAVRIILRLLFNLKGSATGMASK